MEKKEVFYDLKVCGKIVEFDDKEFIAFNGVDKKGKKFTVKFTKDCDDVPTEEGKYIITVNKKYINKDKSSIYNVYWVRKIESVNVDEGEFEDNEEDYDF